MTCSLAPSHLSGEQKAQICGVLAVGCDWHTAANVAGCRLSEIRLAIRQDPEFAARVRRSEASAELSHIRTVQEAAKDVKNWRASVWWLERHAPERFGPRHAGVVTVRQLKAFVAVLADVLSGGSHGEVDRGHVVERLRKFAESIDQLFCDERMTEANPLDSSPPLGESAATANFVGNDAVRGGKDRT